MGLFLRKSIMTTVLISGSISIKYKDLPSEVFESLDRIMSQGLEVIIGDAPGVDSGIQWYLKSKNYSKVTIYYSIQGNYHKARNNWGFKTIPIIGSYVDRDKAMCEIADYGLAIWDGHSKGTAGNIRRVAKTKIIKIEKSRNPIIKVNSN